MNPRPLSPPKLAWEIELPSFRAEIDRILANGTWSNYSNDSTDQLHQLLQQFTGCEPLTCSSGSIGIELALRACRVEPGDEVILAGYDYPGNFRCIEAVGGLAVVVDTEPNSWSINLQQVRDAISPRTKAIIVSHLHGEVQEIAELRSIATPSGIVIIEDACQVVGGSCNNQLLGSLGDIGVWSFGGSKLLTAGRGGAVFSHDPTLLQRARIASQRSNDAVPLSVLQAAMLLPQLRYLEQMTSLRHQATLQLYQHLSQSQWFERSSHTNPTHSIPGYYKVGLLLKGTNSQRDAIVKEITSLGGEVGMGFRGFASRSSHRCRKLTNLINTQQVAERTLVIHHRHLLHEPRELENLCLEVNRLAEAVILGG
jgi:dTDP-4-amino-4,6-dideoxygalactose transaminase